MAWRKSTKRGSTWEPGDGKAQADGGNVDDDDLVDLLGRAATGHVDKDLLLQLAKALRKNLNFSRKGVGLSGSGLAELLMKTAPRIPIRDAETLSAQYHGMTGPSLAGNVIRNAGRSSAAIGAMTGALASAGELAPPLWVMLPAEIIGETLIIAAIEMKLVAELHEVYGHPIQGDAHERGLAIVSAWSERRGVNINDLHSDNGVSQALGRGTRKSIVQLLRRKLMARAARNVSSLAPMFIGAAAGAELNRRATRDLGDAVVRDLASFNALSK